MNCDTCNDRVDCVALKGRKVDMRVLRTDVSQRFENGPHAWNDYITVTIPCEILLPFKEKLINALIPHVSYIRDPIRLMNIEVFEMMVACDPTQIINVVTEANLDFNKSQYFTYLSLFDSIIQLYKIKTEARKRWRETQGANGS